MDSLAKPSKISSPLFILIYVAFASAYIYFRAFDPWSGEIVIKVIPLIMLIALVRRALSGIPKHFMTFALGFSMLGDIFMSLKGYFLFGLGFFLIAQLGYCALFLRDWKWQVKRLPWLLFIVLYITVIAYWILPQTGNLKWVIFGYMCAISSMAISAGFRASERWLWVAVGAFIFMTSDSLIAINKFAFPIELSGVYIMVTYYLAQILISYGILRDLDPMRCE